MHWKISSSYQESSFKTPSFLSIFYENLCFGDIGFLPKLDEKKKRLQIEIKIGVFLYENMTHASLASYLINT